MTIVEFLHPLNGRPIKDLCLAVLYYERQYESRDASEVQEVRRQLKRARVPRASKLNLSNFLSKCSPYVDVAGKRGQAFRWTLTPTGEAYVRKMLRLPQSEVEIEHDVSSLETILKSISNEAAANYIREAIKCLSVGALRAATVFLWSGTVRQVQQAVLACGKKEANDALRRFDANARRVRRVDDFAYVKESTLLLVAQELGVFDKNERVTLEEALNLRNRCGHPGKYRPGIKKVSSMIEDVVSIVFS